jgi:hypothetical protein
MNLEVSFMLLEKIYSTGITQDDRHLRLSIVFEWLVQWVIYKSYKSYISKSLCKTSNFEFLLHLATC